MKFSAVALLAIIGRASAFVVTPAVLDRPVVVAPPRYFVVSEPNTLQTATTEAPTVLVAPQQTPASVVSTEVTPQPILNDKPKGEAAAVEKTSPMTRKADLPVFDANAQIVPGRYASLDHSIAIPLLQRPPHLDGTHAGDYGFDPCGLSETFDLYYMQECELRHARHARLAMLAAVGWPLSELLAPSFMLQDNGRAPSILNGFNPITAVAVLGMFAAFGYLEYTSALRRTADTELGTKHRRDMEQVWEFGVAGDYNFDPLGWYSLLGDDAAGRRAMRSVEISHGRWAMVGVAAFAGLEALSGRPVVEQFGLFFHPNPVLPLMALSYFVWSQFYQISDVREYPIRVEYTKDGEEMLRGIQRALEKQRDQQ